MCIIFDCKLRSPIMDSSQRNEATNNESIPPQTPPSPGVALVSIIIYGIVSVFYPKKDKTRNLDNQDDTPALQSVYKACVSGKLCNSPWTPIPCEHSCSSCKNMHFWCFGNNSKTIEFKQEYCMLCSDGKASERNAEF